MTATAAIRLATLLSALALLPAGSSAPPYGAPDCTAAAGVSLRFLGNRMARDGVRGHARNPWDLQVFDGRVFLGGGSTTENAGPVNVWAFDPAKRRFVREYRVDEEAIELFRVLDGALFIPAADPVAGDANKYYRRDARGTWSRGRGGPELAHVRDLGRFRGRLIGVGNSRDPKHRAGAVLLAPGEPRPATDPASLGTLDNWFYALFAYRGTLFAPSYRFTPSVDTTSILTFDAERERFDIDPAFSTSDFVPVTGAPAYERSALRPWLPIEFEGSLIYPLRTYCAHRSCYRQLYLRSYGMFLKSAPHAPPLPVRFPDPDAQGEDLLLRDGVLYALANRHRDDGRYTLHLYRTRHALPDAGDWQELLHLDCANRGRAFEYLDGVFYVGLGHDYGEPAGDSGALLALTPP